MKKKYLIYAAMPVLAVALLLATEASAHGFGMFRGNATPQELATRHAEMFQEQAALLGVSVDDVKSAWAQGKSLWELAQEKGISEDQLQAKMKEARLAQIKSHLSTLVSQGVITQAQADQRYSWMTSQEGSVGKRMGRGFRGARGMGMMF